MVFEYLHLAKLIPVKTSSFISNLRSFYDFTSFLLVMSCAGMLPSPGIRSLLSNCRTPVLVPISPRRRLLDMAGREAMALFLLCDRSLTAMVLPPLLVMSSTQGEAVHCFYRPVTSFSRLH